MSDPPGASALIGSPQLVLAICPIEAVAVEHGSWVGCAVRETMGQVIVDTSSQIDGASGQV